MDGSRPTVLFGFLSILQCGDAVVKLKSFAEIAESINYLYVINDQKQLVGVLCYRISF
ncbi:hypothetical protein ACEQPO_10490 [Bacillus sp. SL00103]